MDILLEEYRTCCMTAACAFCKRRVPTRGPSMQGRKRHGTDLPLLRGFHPQNVDPQRAPRHIQHGRENPNRSAISEIPPLALQAAGHRLLPDPAKPFQNQSAVPVISGASLIGFSVPIAQSTERECPKLQVAGESPAGDTISGGCGSTAECGRPMARRRCDSVPPAPVHRGRSSSAERSLDMREAKRAALFVPTILEGIAQPARADASHASGQRCNSFCPHHLFVPVV